MAHKCKYATDYTGWFEIIVRTLKIVLYLITFELQAWEKQRVENSFLMVTHNKSKCQPSYENRAYYTYTITAPHYFSNVVSNHEKSSVIWLWCGFSVVVVSVWCARSLHKGWHLWATICFPDQRFPHFRWIIPLLGQYGRRASRCAASMYRLWRCNWMKGLA